MSTSLQQLRDLVRAHDIRAVVSDLDGVLRIFDHSLWAELDAADAAIAAWLASPAHIDREVVDLLDSLRQAELGVFVLTNGTDRVPEELHALGMTPFLGPGRRFLLNTADLGAAKPDPEAYERAQDRIEQELGETLRAGQVAFLDDSPRHVRGAARFGWHAVLHHGPSGPV